MGNSEKTAGNNYLFFVNGEEKSLADLDENERQKAAYRLTEQAMRAAGFCKKAGIAQTDKPE